MANEQDDVGFGRAAFALAIGTLDNLTASGAMTAVQRERIINGAIRQIEGPKYRAAETELRKQLGRRLQG
jgi:hypothetical protein